METASHRGWTYLGLGIALLGIPAVVTASRLPGAPLQGDGLAVARELAIFGLAALLIWIVRSGEGLTLHSINLRFDRPGRSLVRGLLLTLACFAVLAAALVAYSAFGVRYGPGSAIASTLPVILLTVIRAAIVEEIFYRGYAIERLDALTGSRWAAAGVSLLAFSAFHFRQGLAGMALVLLIGAVLTGFYLWKRDLAAAIIAHFLVDFIPNVALPAVGAAA